MSYTIVIFVTKIIHIFSPCKPFSHYFSKIHEKIIKNILCGELLRYNRRSKRDFRNITQC